MVSGFLLKEAVDNSQVDSLGIALTGLRFAVGSANSCSARSSPLTKERPDKSCDSKLHFGFASLLGGLFCICTLHSCSRHLALNSSTFFQLLCTGQPWERVL
ncbi:hypothetical protein QYF61_003320 [Mycteria americana]|uniref:Uncharacterized protein n=1 Tax=Mycteria americana TaxID=33587 RepID=A0AAN7NA08_MYCAM|nr:hypothetical protein QYF61_003320 [Mycteria americana]